MNPNSRVLLSVGRIDTQKDPLRVLAAFEQVAEQFSDVALLYVGNGDLETPLRNQIKQSKFAARVHLAGWQPDVAGIMAASSVLVSASRWEGMPNVILEAAAARLPVVATSAEGVTEIIRDSNLGVLVGIQDTASLAQGISTALSDVTTKSKAIALQTLVAKHFTWQRVVEQYSALFESIPLN